MQKVARKTNKRKAKKKTFIIDWLKFLLAIFNADFIFLC
jgi:hypothetical protein